MKLGKTGDERNVEREARIDAAKRGINKRKVFAFFPVYCNNTRRKVWLEFVINFEDWNSYDHRFYERNHEIIKEKQQ